MEENLTINRKNEPDRIAGRLTDESGIVLIAALLVMIFLTFIGTTVVILSSSNIKVSRNTENSSQAFMVAEAGVAEAINCLRASSSWGPNGDCDNDTTTTWANESTGAVTLNNGKTGNFNIVLFDNTGTSGRTANRGRQDLYADLHTGEVLVEASGMVDGFTRVVSVIVRSSIKAFEFALFSEGAIDAVGVGNDPGTINGEQYATVGINWSGNYDLTQSEVSSPNRVAPSCPGKWRDCSSGAGVEQIDAPMLDFAYYQEQTNFDGGANPQQVFIMTPMVSNVAGNTADCTGQYEDLTVGCDSTWMIRYSMETLGGNPYAITARVEARNEGGNTWDNQVFYCANPTPANPWNGRDAVCPSEDDPVSFTFRSDKAENTKPFINAPQFNAYTRPTENPYILDENGLTKGSIVNVFDATNHLEFLGPTAPESTTVKATILVGTDANNSTPVGKIDIEGGTGALVFEPTNGLAIVAEKIAFKAKYSDINVTVGSTQSGALLIAKRELEVEGENNNNVSMTLNGSAVVGGDNQSGTSDTDNTASIEIEHTADFNVNYVPIAQYPAGWTDFGSVSFERREWREL